MVKEDITVKRPQRGKIHVEIYALVLAALSDARYGNCGEPPVATTLAIDLADAYDRGDLPALKDVRIASETGDALLLTFMSPLNPPETLRLAEILGADELGFVDTMWETVRAWWD